MLHAKASNGVCQNESKLPSESRRADSRGELRMNKQGAGSLSEAAYSNLQGTENLRYALNSSSQEGQAYHTSPGVESLHEDAEHSETGSEGDNGCNRSKTLVTSHYLLQMKLAARPTLP